MKKILGLDLGTNSIGWALVEQDFNNRQGKILGMGSRIIPMSQDILGDFDKGNSVSQTSERTRLRGIRRLRERHLLRRQRLHRVLKILSFLPEHYAKQIDFERRLGQFLPDKEPKLAYNDRGFIFIKSFEEMLNDFRSRCPELLIDKRGESRLIPYDWTIYYLRNKALNQKIEKEELAWILLNFNQKRGYYQLRDEEEEENPNKLSEYYRLKIIDVIIDPEKNRKGETWYSLILENGWVYRRSSKTSLLNWKDRIRDFIVTTDLNEDGSVKKDKEGNEKRSFRSPGEEDWTLQKKKTEHDIGEMNVTVGTFIYTALLRGPQQKIKGQLVRTIERKFYKDELKKILEKQIEFHSELQDESIYNDCIHELYRNNESHQNLLMSKDFVHLFINDIIFYQRPLRSQKSSIGNCTLEFRKYKDKNSHEQTQYLKAIPKSNPYYQEFRIWQWMYNITVYRKDDNFNVTTDYLSCVKDWEDLFAFLNDRKEIDQKGLLKYLIGQKGVKGKKLTEEIEKFRWNYVEDKKYPCNETRTNIIHRLGKVENVSDKFLTREIEQTLWHIIYSITDKADFEKALKTFAIKFGLDTTSFVTTFVKFPPFKSEYGAYSEKAIKKLLPLMRIGKYWNWDNIDEKTKERIDKILTGEYDGGIKERVREKALHLKTTDDFQGLQLWLAQYIIYDRHSEASLVGKGNSLTDLEKYLLEFKQYSLRNPIVEKIVTETLRVTRDIWSSYGNGDSNYFDEIHIELGREMKNTAEARKRITSQISENENTNLRIKALIAELKRDASIANVRPHSPLQQEALKIYEEGVLNSDIEIPDDIARISKSSQPERSEMLRYKLWLEQKYRSPYTGEIIPLSGLFTSNYQIEHIIPQSRYFDDSMSNKVICESAVNQLKDNQLGLEFIKKHHGEIIPAENGNKVKIFLEDEYVAFVKMHYGKNRTKQNKLMLEEIPDKMIERQLNDTRYISKFISNLLSNIVRGSENDDGINSKNIISVNGKITSILKKDWGLNDVWNELILPRFERMNQITHSDKFTSKNTSGKTIPSIPIEISKGFQKKRIDHRHHAMDALVIACTTRDHINLLNNKHANERNQRFDLNRKLRKFEKVSYIDVKSGKQIDREVPREFIKPWGNFTVDSKNTLSKIIVSFKQNIRVINRASNSYSKWIVNNGDKAKGILKQAGTNWAIRKSLHKDTVSGKVDLRRIKIPKGKILTATRKTINSSFNLKTIESITDTGIQKILINYLSSKGNDPELAFSPEGVEDMNRNIRQYNDGQFHQPIYKARIFELGNKFPLGSVGNKKTKFVEADKGTNLFFAVYENEEGKRTYETVPLNEVIEYQKQSAHLQKEQRIPIQPNPDKGKFLFVISPNDLVLVPKNEDIGDVMNENDLYDIATDRIYKMVSCTGNECHFVQANIASLIKNYESRSKIGELGSLNKLETTMDLIDPCRIKEKCHKIKVDRLGNLCRN